MMTSKVPNEPADKQRGSGSAHSDFIDIQQYNAKKNQATHTTYQAPTEFCEDLINEAGNYQRKLFKSAITLFKQKADRSFLDHRHPTTLANYIGHFFVQKIECIRSELIDFYSLLLKHHPLSLLPPLTSLKW